MSIEPEEDIHSNQNRGSSLYRKTICYSDKRVLLTYRIQFVLYFTAVLKWSLPLYSSFELSSNFWSRLWTFNRLNSFKYYWSPWYKKFHDSASRLMKHKIQHFYDCQRLVHGELAEGSKKCCIGPKQDKLLLHRNPHWFRIATWLSKKWNTCSFRKHENI